MSDTQTLQQTVTEPDPVEAPAASPAQPVAPTFDQLMNKPRRTTRYKSVLQEGEPAVLFEFAAIPPVEFSGLVTLHPPTDAQKVADPSANVNTDTFPPALLAEVCIAPKLTAAQWAQLWKNKSWSPGELAALYWEARALCDRPLDLNPFDNG